MPTRARTSRRSCSRSSSPAPTCSAPTSPSRTTSAFSPASLRQLGVNIPWVGSPSVVAVSSTKLAGPALFGTYGVADYAEDSSDASKAFGKLYRDAYKVAPDNQSSWPYDAITVLSAAINKAGSTDPDKIREAILATKKFAGAEGEYNFDQNGDGLARLQRREKRQGQHRLTTSTSTSTIELDPSASSGSTGRPKLFLQPNLPAITQRWISPFNCCSPASASAPSMRLSRSVSC